MNLDPTGSPRHEQTVASVEVIIAWPYYFDNSYGRSIFSRTCPFLYIKDPIHHRRLLGLQ